MTISETHREARMIELNTTIHQKEGEMARSRAVKDGNWLNISGEIDTLRAELNHLENGVAENPTIILATVTRAADVPPPPQPDKISTNGNNTINTPKYTITTSQDTVTIKDKATGKFVRVWGDPHVETSDGDSADFYTKNLTMALDDGSKVTIVPTELSGGVSFSERVVVTNGNESATISGIHSGHMSIQSSDVNGVAADLMTDDGAVMVQKFGSDLDDLTFLDGTEFAGGHGGDRNYIDGRAGLQTLSQFYLGVPINPVLVTTLGFDNTLTYEQIRAQQIQQSWTNIISNNTLLMSIDQGNKLKPGELGLDKLELLLDLALKSGNIDLAFKLFSQTENKTSTLIAQDMMTKIQSLQSQRKEFSATMTTAGQDMKVINDMQNKIQGVNVDIGLLQGFLQEAMSDRRQAKEMLSNYLAAEERSAAAIVQNFR